MSASIDDAQTNDVVLSVGNSLAMPRPMCGQRFAVVLALPSAVEA
jgi:hypothetical protein